MDWKQYLKPHEIERLKELQRLREENLKERKRIADRCRMRRWRADKKETT